MVAVTVSLSLMVAMAFALSSQQRQDAFLRAQRERRWPLEGYRAPLPNIHAKGETYNAAFDCERLGEQQRRVLEAMQDGQ